MTLLPRVAPTTLDPASWRASAGRIGAIARRHGYVMLRSPHRLFDVTVWPLVDLLIFGSIGVFAGRLSAGDITARDNQVRLVLAEQFQHPRQQTLVVLQVGVHHGHVARLTRQHPFYAGAG